MKRLAVLLAVLLALGGVTAVASASEPHPPLTMTAEPAPMGAQAQAASVTSVWTLLYGSYYRGDSDVAVASNRNPTWVVGSNPKDTFQSDGNFVGYASACHGANGSCWSTGTSGICGPSTARWQKDGNFVIYDCRNVARWASGTGPNPGYRKYAIVLWNNACTDIYADPELNGWALVWKSYPSSTCNIGLA